MDEMIPGKNIHDAWKKVPMSHSPVVS